VVRPPAVDVVAAAIFGTNDHFVALDKRLLTKGAAFFKKWGMTADTNGTNHQNQPGTATLSIYQSPNL
jgi:calcineurin-like phosphoesterase